MIDHPSRSIAAYFSKTTTFAPFAASCVAVVRPPIPEPMTTASYSSSVGALGGPVCNSGCAGGATVAIADTVMFLRSHVCLLATWKFEHMNVVRWVQPDRSEKACASVQPQPDRSRHKEKASECVQPQHHLQNRIPLASTGRTCQVVSLPSLLLLTPVIGKLCFNTHC